MNASDVLKPLSVMEGTGSWSLPRGFDWQPWVERWDRMQARYLVKREERFALLARIVRECVGLSAQVVDLGCGPGSLMEVMLDAMPRAEVWGIDFDPAALLLARARLARYGERAHLALADLRSPTWTDDLRALVRLPREVDVVVSATALHWLKPGPLAALYGQIAALLRPGGLLLNADHVGSDCLSLQAAWERHRTAMRAAQGNRILIRGGSESEFVDDWDSFWTAYTAALGLDAAEADARVLGGWDGGVEEGLPLAWHLDALREAGFGAVDCFWRCDCDAIYGGFRLL
jgi:SAM-dependent methyltransferase